MITFSIVTPTFNRAHMIREAIESVRAQTHQALEHIIMDGGSTDETLNVLKGYPELTVVSERDKGLYDAINKGIARAKGDVIVLVNSDDALLPNALELAAKAFDAEPDKDSFCGKVLIGPIDRSFGDRILGSEAMQEIRDQDLISGLTLTNGRFFRRSVFERIGMFDLRYPVASDRDFLARCHLANMSTIICDKPVYRYGGHLESLTFSGSIAPDKQLEELCEISRDRLREANSGRERRYYQTWAAWTHFYRFLRSRKFHHFKLLLMLLASNPQSAVFLCRQLFWHVSTREERRGLTYNP